MTREETYNCEVIETLARIAAKLQFNDDNDVCDEDGEVLKWNDFRTIDVGQITYNGKTVFDVTYWGDGTTEISGELWSTLSKNLVDMVIERLYEYIGTNILTKLAEVRVDRGDDSTHSVYVFRTKHADKGSFLAAVKAAVDTWVSLNPDIGQANRKINFETVFDDIPRSIAASFGFLPCRDSITVTASDQTDVRQL